MRETGINIFFLDNEPEIAAQSMCDCHVIKMVLESAQLLCTCHNELGSSSAYGIKPKFYKSTHKNHPCQKWIQKCVANYNWLALHALELCNEYTYRYSKRHKSQNIIEWCNDNVPDFELHLNSFFLVNPEQKRYGTWLITDPAQAMPEELQSDDPVRSYRDYYWTKQFTMKKPMLWAKREKPDWWIQKELLQGKDNEDSR